MTALLAVVFSMMLMPQVEAQPADSTVRAFLHPSSRMWIDGSSSVNRFTCRTGAFDGRAVLPGGAVSIDEAEVVIRVPVRTLDCGQRRMNADLQQAMRADTYPHIRFELDDVTVAPRSTTEVGRRTVVEGRLTIAGVQRTLTLGVTVTEVEEGIFELEGHIPLRMTDFGIDPPSPFMGLVRVTDQIIVRFQLYAGLCGDRAIVGRCV